jgi:hypothetical protein
MSSSLMVVMAKLASNLSISAPPAVPVTTICSTSSSGVGACCARVGGAASRALMQTAATPLAAGRPMAGRFALEVMEISPLVIRQRASDPPARECDLP